METIEEIEQELQVIEQATRTLIEAGKFSDLIKELLNEERTYLEMRLARLKTGRTPDSVIIAKFDDNNKIIENVASKEVYKQAIEEFGIEEVYRHFPQYFLEQPDGLTDVIKVAPNRYLKVGLNNSDKKRNLKAISEQLNRRIYVFFSLR
jgi:hypothetical protein